MGNTLALIQKRILPIIAILVGFFSLIQTTLWIFQQKWPLDYNGFYYLLEWKARIAHGSGVYSKFQPFLEISGAVLRLFQINETSAFPFFVLLSLLIFNFAILFPLRKKNTLLFAFFFLWLMGSRLAFYVFYGYLKQGWGMAFLAVYLNSYSRFIRIATLPLALSFHFSSAFLLALKPLICSSEFTKKKNIYAIAGIGTMIFILFKKQQLASYLIEPHFRFSFYFDYFKNGQISAFDFFEFLFSVTVTGITFLDAKKNAYIFTLSILVILAFFPIWGIETWRMWISGVLILFVSVSQLCSNQEPRLFTRSLPFLTIILIFAQFTLPKTPHLYGSILRPESLEIMKERLQAWIPEDAVIKASINTQYEIAYFLKRKTYWKPIHANFEYREHSAQIPCRLPECMSIDEFNEIVKIDQ